MSPPPPPRPSLCLRLTGLFLLNLPGLRGGALSTAEAAPGARWVGGMEGKLETL